jgi:CheY-like chemotaxis protein
MREILERTLLGIDVVVAPGAESRGTVVGDRAQLEQVVMNLVVNARDAVRESGGRRVHVRTLSEGTNVVLEVVDDGPGIPPELRERVFEPYFTTKTQGADRGTGLGLATVYGIVATHDGKIEIAAGLDGGGTTMRVTIPAAAQIAPEEPAPRPKTGERVENGGGAVLVVDDDGIVRRALVTTLQSLGYVAVEAASGADAIELYRTHPGEIRAVLLDMIMPGMNGTATYRALRELDRDVAVVLMSGHTSNEEAQTLIDDGARGFVAKPYSADSLARALAAALA